MWIEWLPFTLLAIRSTVHSATGFTPFELMFARPQNPMVNYNAVLNWEASAEQPPVLAILSTCSTHIEHAHKTRASAQAAATSAQSHQRNRQDYRNKVSFSRLKHNTCVFIKEPHPSHKLAHRFMGPFKIDAESTTTQISDNYHLIDTHGKRLDQSFPRDQLFVVVQQEVKDTLRQQRLYSLEEWQAATDSCNQIQAGPLPSTQTTNRPSGEWWAVERILDQRKSTSGNDTEVLVKWSGYPTTTWVSQSFVDSTSLPKLLRDMRADQARQQGLGQASRMRRQPLPNGQPSSTTETHDNN